ncbi:MAG: hypothetical protein LBO63_01205 [Oscillospiraceae bacterium]|jgi:hypothetical protein|nr:hypothetical protein [Oscillospiraceae bacterium]
MKIPFAKLVSDLGFSKEKALASLKRRAVRFLVLLVVLFSAVAIINAQMRKSVLAQLSAAVPAASFVAETESRAKYIVSEYNGYVAVYDANKSMSVPEFTTEIKLSGLLRYDRELLKNGLTVSTMEEILMILEDLDE